MCWSPKKTRSRSTSPDELAIEVNPTSILAVGSASGGIDTARDWTAALPMAGDTTDILLRQGGLREREATKHDDEGTDSIDKNKNGFAHSTMSFG